VFLPAVRPLLSLAAELETERNHVLPPPAGPADSLDLLDELAEEQPEQAESALLEEWQALTAEAQFAHVLHGGRAVTPDAGSDGKEDDYSDFVGLPGLLSAEQTAALLARRDDELRKRATRARRPDPAAPPDQPAVPAEPAGPAVGSWRAAADLRREVNRLVSVLAARTGTPHAALHAQVRTAVPGPASASASVELLESRRAYLMARM
jgi:hypothetical protein